MTTEVNDVLNVTIVKGDFVQLTNKQRKNIKAFLRAGLGETQSTLTAVLKLILSMATLPLDITSLFDVNTRVLFVKSTIQDAPTYGAERVFDELNEKDVNDLTPDEKVKLTRAKESLLRVYGSYTDRDEKRKEYLCTFSLPDHNKTFSFVPTQSQFDALETYFDAPDFDDEQAIELTTEIEIIEGRGEIPNYARLNIIEA